MAQAVFAAEPRCTIPGGHVSVRRLTANERMLHAVPPHEHGGPRLL